MGDILQPPGHPISYFPKLAKVTGSVKAAILAQQISYWTPRAHDAEGWIYKTQTEWMDETGFTLKEFRGACEELEARKLIRKEYDRPKHELRIQLQLDAYNLALQGIKENRAPAKRAHAKRAHAKRAGGIYQKGISHMPKGNMLPVAPIKESYESSRDYTEITTEITPPLSPQGVNEHEPTWGREWPKAKRFPTDFPRTPPVWFLQYCAEKTPHVDVTHEWEYMLDQTFRSLRTQFFMVARRWMETEEEKRQGNGARASPRSYTQADHSPEAQAQLRKKLEAIDRGDG